MPYLDHTEFLDAVGLPAVVSSKPQNWQGVVLEQQRQPPSEFDVPAVSQHLVIFLLGTAIPLVQERGGRSQRGKLVPGEILVTPAGQPSHWITGGAVDAVHLLLTPTLVEQTAEAIGMTPDQAQIMNNFGTLDPHLEQIGRLLLDEAQAQGLGGRLYAESLINALAVHLLRNYSASGEVPVPPASGLPKSTLHRVIEYINDNLGNDLSLYEMAQAVEISPNYFATKFKQSMGLAPHQYVIKKRVERAESLLLGSHESIGEVAAQVGFYDQSHLTRHFKNLVGVTPKRLLAEREET